MASIWVAICGALCGYLVIACARALYVQFVTSRRTSDDLTDPRTNVAHLITIEELSKYNGMDPYRPLALAVRGHVYDVSRGVAFYGPGKAYSVYAGKEISRALGKMSLEESDCNGDISDLTEKELRVLEQWEGKLAAKYPVVGKVVPPLILNADELKAYDGTDESKPTLLSIRSVLFDVSNAKAFYGPDGAYPFAGRECSRALATYSIEDKDCSDSLDDCSLSEMDALRSWEAQFHSKYKVVGRLTHSQ